MASTPFSFQTNKGSKVMEGAYELVTNLDSLSALNKVYQWADEEKISRSSFVGMTDSRYSKFGSAYGDDNIGNLLMHTPLVSKDFSFTKWIGISTEGSIQFYDKEITSHTRSEYDSGFTRSYVNGYFYPVISFDFEGTDRQDSKIIDGKYYSDENVTLIWLYYGQYNDSYNRFPVAIRIKKNKIEFYFSSYVIGSDQKASRIPLYINTWENGTNKRYVMANLSANTNYLSFSLGGAVGIEYAESDDGITFSPYVAFRSNNIPKKRFLKFRASIDGGLQEGEKKVFEFDQSNPETKLILNDLLSSVNSNVQVNSVHKIDGIQDETYTDGKLFEIPIDRTKYKSIAKIEIV